MKIQIDRTRALGVAALLAAVGGVLAAATAVSRHFFEQPAEDARRTVARRHADAGRHARPDNLFLVGQLEGTVEALHKNQWMVVMAGDRLSAEDVLRTGPGARAVLRRRDSELVVEENIDVRLNKLAAQTASFALLRGGTLVASVGAANEELQITAEGTSAVNEGVARFAVSRAPAGHVSVAVLKGAALFDARGQQVRVTAGTESIAPPGRAPSEPAPIPEEILLSVFWPSDEEPNLAERTQIRGQVRPSSRVKVNGADAPISADGKFSASVPLVVGANRVQVDARDITGRKKSVSRVVRRTAKAPALEPADEEIWKK